MRILLAGSGKMARNVGFFLLRGGNDVAWVDRDHQWLLKMEKRIGKDRKRLASVDEQASPGEASFFLAGEPGIPECDVLLETIEEDVEAKRGIIAGLRDHLVDGGLVLTNSSSILPDELGTDITGAHFFYPVEMTGFVEAIFPDPSDPGIRTSALDFLRGAGLDVIVQGPSNAFAVNRLLLPVQNECFRALLAGRSAIDVDEASVSDLLPVGTLTLMDAIGLDTVHEAAKRYVERMSPDEATGFLPLTTGLQTLTAMGKRGTKNRDGLLKGRPLPWAKRELTDAEGGLASSLATLFSTTCTDFVDRGEMDERSLGLALSSLFGVDYPGRTGTTI